MTDNRKIGLSRYRQTGGIGGVIIWVLVFGGILTMGARLGPLYLDHNTMSNVLDGLSQEAGMGAKGDGELKGIIKQRFKLNNIREFNIDEHIDIERSGRGTNVVLDYEVRMPLLGNVDMIASFSKTVELRD